MKFTSFHPSNKILEMICFEDSKSDLRYYYGVYPRGNMKFKEDLAGMYIQSIYNSILNYYGIFFEFQSLNYQKVAFVAYKAFKNCQDHGLKNHEIFSGLFLGGKGVCYGFFDGGGYFKKEEIKFKYENKILMEKFNQKTLKENFQAGVNEYIYPHSDYIEVDSKKDILYIVQLKEKIIKSKNI